jgi:hypothetical protein
LSDRSGVQAGIEPAMDADLITYVGIARDVRDAPHLCTRGCDALRAGSATFAELNLAEGDGDVASDDATVWSPIVPLSQSRG